MREEIVSFDKGIYSIFLTVSNPQTVRTMSRAAGFTKSSQIVCGFLFFATLQATRYEAKVMSCVV